MKKKEEKYWNELSRCIHQLYNDLDDDCKRYEYSNEKQRAELRKKYELLTVRMIGKNGKMPQIIHDRYKKYGLFQFIFYGIPRELDARYLILWKEKGCE